MMNERGLVLDRTNLRGLLLLIMAFAVALALRTAFTAGVAGPAIHGKVLQDAVPVHFAGN